MSNDDTVEVVYEPQTFTAKDAYRVASEVQSARRAEGVKCQWEFIISQIVEAANDGKLHVTITFDGGGVLYNENRERLESDGYSVTTGDDEESVIKNERTGSIHLTKRFRGNRIYISWDIYSIDDSDSEINDNSTETVEEPVDNKED